MTRSKSYPTTRVPSTPYGRATPPNQSTLRLDGNEGDTPPSLLLRRLASLETSALRDYPNTAELEQEIATRFDVDPERVVVTAGADDALDRVCRAYLEPGRELLVPIPTFEMIHRFAASTGATVVTVPWSDAFPTDDVVRSIRPNTAVVAIVSPNNPTGSVASAADLARVAAAAESAYVLLDHAYVEYADADLTHAALGHENVLLVRTFSKAWGLAGCRVGYLIAAPEIASVIRNAGNPYPVSALSLAVVSERLRVGEAAMKKHVARVRDERERLRARLDSLGVSSPPAQGNFLFAELQNRARFVYDGLAACGVLVRFFPHREEIATGLRISIPGSERDFQKLNEALDICLAPEALLFDLDGVLANVENSYRRCTLETVRSFGLSLERKDLECAVLAGDANNDWILSQRLLAENGIEVAFDTLYEQYQKLYLGSEDSPGLRETETLLVEPEVLRQLSERIPLAIVTGRPRAEAEWFLEKVGVRDLFQAVVCLEDGPNKPDPTPVRLALSRLDVSRAWMVGDTPDDIRAASAAGVLPLAILAPGANVERGSSALKSAGAATILEDIETLLELLP